MPPASRNCRAFSPQIAQKSHSHNGAAVANRANPIIEISVGMSSQWNLSCWVAGLLCCWVFLRHRATKQPSNPATNTIVIITIVHRTYKIDSTSKTRNTLPLPYRNASPRSIGPGRRGSRLNAIARPRTVMERMATRTAVISMLQKHASLPPPHHLPHPRIDRTVPDRDVSCRAEVLEVRAVVRSDQRKDLAPRQKIAGAVIGVRVAVIPLHRRNDDRDRVAIIGPRAHFLQKARVLLPGAVGPAQQRRRQPLPADKRQLQKLRLDAEGDDREDRQECRDAAGLH